MKKFATFINGGYIAPETKQQNLLTKITVMSFQNRIEKYREIYNGIPDDYKKIFKMQFCEEGYFMICHPVHSNIDFYNQDIKIEYPDKDQAVIVNDRAKFTFYLWLETFHILIK